MTQAKTDAGLKGLKRRRDAYVLAPECENVLIDMAEYAPSKVSVFRKAYAGDSLRAALNAKCLECVSHSTHEIRECTTVTCPIWAVRPYQRIRL